MQHYFCAVHLSLDEEGCTFYVNYLIIIFHCKFNLNLSIAKNLSIFVKFTINDSITKIFLGNLQFQDLPHAEICSAKISTHQLIEFCSPNKPLSSNIQSFLFRATKDPPQKLLSLIIKKANKVCFHKQFEFCVARIETKKEFLLPENQETRAVVIKNACGSVWLLKISFDKQ